MLRITKLGGLAVAVALLLAAPAGASEADSRREARAARMSRAPGHAYQTAPAARPSLRSLWRHWSELAEARLRRGVERVPPRWRPYLDQIAEFVAEPAGRRVGLGSVVGLVVLIGLLRLARRPGDLVVFLDYPAELRGTFSVRIATRKSAIRRRPPSERERLRDGVSTRTEHHLVARETQFRGVRPGRYWVGIEGILQEPATQLLVGEPFEVRAATVRARRSTRVELDFRPSGCTVTVKVVWNREPVHDGTVALSGRPDTLRYTRQGTAKLEVPLGSHQILAGSGDRVGACEVELETFLPRSVAIDLGQSDALVFKGCPPAVAPYLRGDLGTAARALARDGQDQLAHRLRAFVHEEGGQLELAVTLYEKAGDTENAIRLLTEVQPGEPGYVEACERLAESFERSGEFDQAAAKIEAALAHVGSERQAELYLRRADLLELADDPRGALTALERLAEHEPEHPEVASRTELLEKKLEGQQTVLRPPAAPAAEADAASASRYQLLERIGTGGMGVVFRALDRRLGREVALKRLPEAMRDNPIAVAMFLREARSAASLNHPNIVTLFDADEEDDCYFITMELLAGVTLGKLKKARGRVGAPELAGLLRQVADGLHYAHARRIVHRDIKPANLFLTLEGVVKIMDFGLAKTMEEVRRASTVIGGTPFYMAPEQASGGAVDPAADLYSLGITLFELATGRLPFEGGDVSYEHRHSAPPDPREITDLPDALAELVLHLLAKQPAERPPSAAVVAQRLEAIARD